MKIIINITKEEVNHLKNCSSEFDSCGFISDIIQKVKRSIKHEQKTRFNFEMLQSIFLSVIMVAILMGVALFILSKFNLPDICKSYCDDLKGELIFYECQNPPIFSNGTLCNELKTGLYCELPNQSLSCKDILNNITNMG